MYVFRILAACRRFRATRLDPFGRSADRQLERRLIREYESTIEVILDDLCLDNLETAIEIAALPLEIRGYGPVKSAATKVAERKEEVSLEEIQHLRENATTGSGIRFVDAEYYLRRLFLGKKIFKCAKWLFEYLFH